MRRFLKFPERFCDDSRPSWTLFAFFIVCCALLAYTLYARQPERYRQLTEWFSFRAKRVNIHPLVQAANFAPAAGPRFQSSGNAINSGAAFREAGVSPATGRVFVFRGMTFKDAPSVPQTERNAARPRRGVRITAVEKRSVAGLSGFQVGDVVVSVNRLPTASLVEFERVVRQFVGFSPGLLFDVYRNGRLYYMTLATSPITG
jgi:hypothetical protein